MTYFQLDDQFPDHPSVVGLSMAAIGLWTCGLAYCSRYLTDGEITRKALYRVCPQADAESIVAELVETGRWLETERGWRVKDYLQHNRSRAHVEAIREQRAEAGRLGGIASGQVRGDKSEAKQTLSTELSNGQAVQRSKTNPMSVSVSVSESCSSRTRSERPEPPPDDGFEEFWAAYPPRNGKRIGKTSAKAQWGRLTRARRMVAMKGVLAYGAHCRRTDQLAKDAHRWLRDGLYEEWAAEADSPTPVPPPPSSVPVFQHDDTEPDFSANASRLREVAANTLRRAP